MTIFQKICNLRRPRRLAAFTPGLARMPLVAVLATWAAFTGAVRAEVVINEIHYAPDVDSENVEYIELHNTGPDPVVLDGWIFTDGVNYTFPAATSLDAGGFLVVGEDPAEFQAKFGFNPYGPWVGNLNNEGEEITLRDAAGAVVDRVDYQLGFPWPTVGDAPGLSIELVNPTFDNNLAGNWRGATPNEDDLQTFVPFGSTWRFILGLAEASSPIDAWRMVGFNDSTWQQGPTLIGYGEPDIVTSVPSSGSAGYTTMYLRKSFTVDNPSEVGRLDLYLTVDDGAVIWLNGVEIGRVDAPPGDLAYDDRASDQQERRSVEISVPNPSGLLQAGDNVLAVHLLNGAISSSDILIEGSLVGRAGPGGGFGPSPGFANTSFEANLPPRLRQVDHSPNRPVSGEPVAITAKATDPEDGVASLVLHYQLVDPGSYIELGDAAYENDWISVPMVDTGLDGDEEASDDVYTAVLPTSLQTHRRLVRYRITATDGAGHSVRVPYPDDPQPNFGYFVYDGVPAWQASIRPGVEPVQTFHAEEMGRLPAYQLISKRSEIENCTWFSRYGGDDYLWTGTLVYDGEIYDHVNFRARGGVWRYAMCKNMWKFRFHRGHEFQAHDDWGRKFPRKWRRLNLGASIQQGSFQHRGEQGMFESVGFRMFNLTGLPAPNTSFVTLRIVDDTQEATADQFEGDFWGVYLVVEQIDGRFLDAHDIPDGNIYKMESGTGPGGGELKHQGSDQVGDNSDLTAFVNQVSPPPTESWWRNNFDVAGYMNYHATVQAIHHHDICCGKNYYYYFNSATGLMQVLPWDLDLTWADNMYQSGDGGTDRDIYDTGRIFDLAPMQIEFGNRVRELNQLLFDNTEGQRLIDEYAGLLTGPATGPTILEADRAMWDYNPKMVDPDYVDRINNDKAGTGRFYKFTPSGEESDFYSFLAANMLDEPIQGSFAAGVQKMKYYLRYRAQSTQYHSGVPLADRAADNEIPLKPSISYIGEPGFPLTGLSFRATNYSGTHPFTARRWRIGEVAPPGAPAYDPDKPQPYEIEAIWESGDITDINDLDVTIPPDVLRAGSTYRFRCQVQDTTGRDSLWSNSIRIAVTEPPSASSLREFLRISEVMYNAPGGGDFDFVELHNTSADTDLELAGAKFTKGVDYTFPTGVVLEPGAYLLVTGNPDSAAFRAHYGIDASLAILGPYDGGLDNGGEELTLRTAAGGEDIATFTYNDGRGWPPAADGPGHALVPLRLDNQVNGALDYPGNWRAGTYRYGSPGEADPAPLPNQILINEIAAHTDYPEPPPLDSNDWIELYNPGPSPVTLGAGWYLSDDPSPDQLTKWMIPAGTTIPAGGRVSFDEQTGFHPSPTSGFGLNKAGEQVLLSYLPGTAEDRIVDAVSFAGQEDEWSLGRWPDGGPFWYAFTPTTRDTANQSPPQQVVVNELMYHPPDTNGVDNARDEFVELRNPTGAAINLFNDSGSWRINGDIDFSFPPGATLPSQGLALLVSFDPSDTAAANAFRAAYGLSTPGPTLYGPYDGKLDNRTARVTLERPQAPDALGDGLSWVVVDQVLYADQAPWPEAADGVGLSLHRADPLRHGSDPDNWVAAFPNPGAIQAGGVPPTITVQPSPPSQVRDVGSTVVYTVSAEGDTPLAFQWRVDGVLLPDATNSTLTLPAVWITDSGVYDVAVANGAGSVISDPVHLAVTILPKIHSHPQDATVAPGASVDFAVTASGTGALSYAWLFNGSPLPGATTRTLTIDDAQEGDVGTYAVTITDANGSRTSDPAQLKLLVPPQVVTPPFDQSTPPGGQITFTVETEGLTPMTYQWKKDGEVVDTQTLESNSASLTITDVQPADAGTYTVTLTNQAQGAPGIESSEAVLTVLIDTDGDGMPDNWETDHQLNLDDPDDADLDADLDGLTNLEEYLANTHPRDPASVLRFDSLEPDYDDQGYIQLTFPAATERRYDVEFKNTLQEAALWQHLLTVPAALTNRQIEVTDDPPSIVTDRYYRIAIPDAVRP